MKHFTLLLFFFISLLSFVYSQPAVKHGKLSVSGTFIIDQNSDTIALHGVSYGWHNWWSRFYNKETVNWLANDWNCSVVRAALGVGPENSYLDKTEWSKELIEAVINGAIENDIYVIIDWHSHKLERDAAITFFSEMAKKYGEYPNIIYEIFNEPVHDSWDTVKSYSIDVIKEIRKHDPDNIILVGSPHWDQDIHLVADDPIEGFDNLMYTVHFYAATHNKKLRRRSQYAIDKGIPVFISECAGMSANGNGSIDYKSWNKWYEWMNKNKLSWILWSVADKDETCSMLKKSASSTGEWHEKDLKEWGIKSRELIKKMVNI